MKQPAHQALVNHASTPRRATSRQTLLSLIYFILPILCSATLISAADSSPSSVGPPPPVVTLFSTLGQPVNAPNAFFGEIFAAGFKTGPDATLLMGVTFSSGNTAPFPVDSASAFLYTDNAGQPGALMANFTPLNTHVEANQLFALITFGHVGVSLQPDHAYWIGLTASEFDNYLWSATGSPAGDLGAASTFQNSPQPAAMYSIDQGATWGDIGGYNFMYSLSGQIVPVPEPATVILLTAGGAIIYLRRRAMKLLRNP